MLKVNRYKILILPPEKQLGNLRRYRSAYPGLLLRSSRILARPHINLLSFKYQARQELELYQEMATVVGQMKCFRVAAYGLKKGPRERLVFLEPHKNRLDLLRWQIAAVIGRTQRQPQLNIQDTDMLATGQALATTDGQLRESLQHFREINFRFYFEVKSLCVLSRPLLRPAPWKPCFELRLGT